MDKKGELIRIRARVYYGLGKLPDVVRICEEMIEIYSTLGDKPKLACAYFILSNPYFFLGELDKALSYTEKAYEIFSNNKTPLALKIMEIATIIMFGVIYHQKGDLIKAINFTKQGLQLAKKNNRKIPYYMALNNLGMQYISFADWDNAIICFEESLAITENFGNPVEISTILDGLFLVHLNKGDFKTAEFISIE